MRNEIPQEQQKGPNDLDRTLDAVRPFTPIPSEDQRPKSITAEKYADLQNLTKLAEIITDKKNQGEKALELPPMTPEEAELFREIVLKTLHSE